MDQVSSWRGLATEESLVGFANLLTSTDPSEQITLKTVLEDPAGNALYPSGNPARLTGTITRPANVLDYAIGDNIGTYTVNVKQKEIITLAGGAGILNISAVGIANRNATFVTDLATTAANFANSYAADFLPTLVVTNVGDTVIFEAAAAGVPFDVPVLTDSDSDLVGVVTNVVANRVAVKEKWTVTLTGSYGTATVTGVGGISKTITFASTLAASAETFAHDNLVDYANVGITVNHSADTITFESDTAGVAIVAPIVTNVTSTLGGTVVHTTANNNKVAQVDIVTLSGTKGAVNITVVGALTKLATFATTLKNTADQFVIDHGAAYTGAGITVTAGTTNTLIFTADVAGTPLATAVVVPIDWDLTGSTANSVPNAVDTAQVDIVTLTGTKGAVTIAVGAESGVATFATSLKATVDAFVVANGATFTDITITAGTTDTIIFTADTPGVASTVPTVTPIDWDLAGSNANDTPNNVAVAQVDIVTLVGTDGSANMTVVGGLTKLIDFSGSLKITADSFVSTHGAAYTAVGITVTAGATDTLIFTANVPGTPLAEAVVDPIDGITGSTANSVPNEAAVAQVDIVTFTGTSGQATISAVAGLTKGVVFTTTLKGTVDKFVTDHATAYDTAGVTVTAGAVSTLIFTAKVAGTPLSAPVVTHIEGDLDGTIATGGAGGSTANVVDTAQVDIVTLVGTSGQATMTVVGGLSKAIIFTTTLKGTADKFVTDHGAAYTGVGITVTAGATNTLIFTADVPGTPLATAVVVHIEGDLTGSCANSVPNEIDIKQVETITLTGTTGYASIAGAGALTKIATYTTSPTLTASNFVTTNSGDYDGQNIVLTSSGPDLIFTAKTAGTGFTAPTISNLANIVGTPSSTQVNVTAVAKVDKITFSGTVGHASVSGTGALTKTVSIITTIEAATAAFVLANAAAYTGQGITVTSNYNYIWFSANVAGANFTSPTITNLDSLTGTIAHNTLNATITALPLTGASVNLGGGGTIKGFKLESDDITFAEKIVRVWLLNAVPTDVVGDNVAFVITYANASKRLAVPYVDITFGALLAGSDSVIGKTDTEIQYVCATADNKLYVLLQTLSVVVAPKSAGNYRLDVNVLKLT